MGILFESCSRKDKSDFIEIDTSLAFTGAGRSAQSVGGVASAVREAWGPLVWSIRQALQDGDQLRLVQALESRMPPDLLEMSDDELQGQSLDGLHFQTPCGIEELEHLLLIEGAHDTSLAEVAKPLVRQAIEGPGLHEV